ncbi:hypothetical protein BDP27DRAFT_1197586, partial [Rhodocollybia butyracea]
LTGYSNYRLFHLLHQICTTFSFDMHTRQINKIVARHNGIQVTLADVYQWLGLQEGTWSNKRPNLSQLFRALQTLQQVVNNQLASPQLIQAYRLWYPYYLSCDQLLHMDEKDWKLSVGWRVTEV